MSSTKSIQFRGLAGSGNNLGLRFDLSSEGLTEPFPGHEIHPGTEQVFQGELQIHELLEARRFRKIHQQVNIAAWLGGAWGCCGPARRCPGSTMAPCWRPWRPRRQTWDQKAGKAGIKKPTNLGLETQKTWD
jgi:hypothetical protein